MFTPVPILNDDLEGFAEYLGFSGLDVDLFYEQYYEMNNESYDEYDYEEVMEECNEWSY